MPFTDNDFKHLKEFLGKYPYINLGHFPFHCVDFLNLIDRLDAAEKINEWAVHNMDCIPKNRQECPCGLYQADARWRKAVGKSDPERRGG